ncbi:MAG: 2-oxoacid:acceptor oxidoreductase family protein [Chloroflexota bacterium]
MLVKTVFAGFGGQGVMSIGLNLAQAAMLEGKYVTYLPSYGAEMRGGTANCTVAVSDEEIASPVASSPEFLVAMNQPSLLRFQNQIDSGGTILVNSSLIEADIQRGDVQVIKVPANKMAEELGSAKSANMVMLGALARTSRLVSMDILVDVLKSSLARKASLFAVNRKALVAGYELH